MVFIKYRECCNCLHASVCKNRDAHEKARKKVLSLLKDKVEFPDSSTLLMGCNDYVTIDAISEQVEQRLVDKAKAFMVGAKNE